MEIKQEELQALLCNDILGSPHAYFQPPANVHMNYPAIVYALKGIDTIRADNGVYITLPHWELTLIDKRANSPFITKIMSLPYCRFDRHFKADNLNHFTFILYF